MFFSFLAAFSEVVTTTLRLDNPSDRIVYFKVKTTAPKHYCVRPNSGVIKPGLSAEINVLVRIKLNRILYDSYLYISLF